MIGTYHRWSNAHLHRYLAEFDLRYSTKDVTDGQRATFGIRLGLRAPQALDSLAGPVQLRGAETGGRMAKRVHITGIKPAQVSDDGQWMLLRTKTADEEELEIAFPHDLLPRLLDWSASGWSVGAKRQGMPAKNRLIFDLEAVQVGYSEGDGELIVSMMIGEVAAVSYRVSPDLGQALLDALRRELDPGSDPTHTGLRH